MSKLEKSLRNVENAIRELETDYPESMLLKGCIEYRELLKKDIERTKNDSHGNKDFRLDH